MNKEANIQPWKVASDFELFGFALVIKSFQKIIHWVAFIMLTLMLQLT